MLRFRPRAAALLLAALAAQSLIAALSPESGSFSFQTFSPKTYGANPQNWAIVQDARGVMYFGNTDGVLEFDGVNWRLIRLTNRSSARSLAIDARGRIYVGGQGEFGYLEPDVNGAMHFVPIPVPKESGNFRVVRDVVPTSSGVYFVTEYNLFFLTNSGQLKVIPSKKALGRIFEAFGQLYVTVVDQGLWRLQGSEFVAGPAGDWAAMGSRFEYAPGSRPVLAARKGLFNFSWSSVTPFQNGASSYFEQNEIYCIQRLSSGDLAIGTKLGLVLLDADGGLERVIRQESGLTSDWVTAIYEDRDHAIWLATNLGLVRFNSSLSSFGPQNGLQGAVVAETRFQGSMYVATTKGAFRMRPTLGTDPAFDPVQGLQEQVFALTVHGDELLAGGDHGAYRISGTKAEKLTTADIGVVYDVSNSSHDPNVIYTAGKAGVRRWQLAGRQWKPSEPAGEIGQDFRTPLEDADGTVWATTGVAIWHFDFSSQPARKMKFVAADGIPTGLKFAYWFRDHVVVATAKGLLRFDSKAGRFVPDFELGQMYGSQSVFLLADDPQGNTWITGEGYHHVVERNSSTVFSSPITQVGAGELFSLFLDRDGVCWASEPGGTLFRQEKLDLAQHKKLSAILLRQVGVIGRKDPLYGGDAPLGDALSLEHRDNDLRFEYAAPLYEAPTEIQYQYRLDGSEKNWSNWTKESAKEYTNLFEGTYRFHVRARDLHGQESPEVTFPFQVLPPFYRTWWAYTTYAAALLITGWLVLKWRLRSLEAQNRWLEGVVQERTAEVRQERDQNEALLLNILPKPVAAELRSNGSVRPTTFEDATVCFSDFVGFTLSSEKLPAETLITALNKYFTAFDEIIGRYGLEKLKTIGDAYMFAGGLPNERPSHAVDSVLAALEMAAVVNSLSNAEQGVNWKIRLGLYSGPVVSGVVGVRKFAFDIWGNTVNFAARMESAGKPGQVNLSETTYQRVAKLIECEARGPVKIKEGREMEMYFAIGPKLELLQGPVVDGIPEAFRKAYEEAFGDAPRSFPSNALLESWMHAPSEPA